MTLIKSSIIDNSLLILMCQNSKFKNGEHVGCNYNNDQELFLYFKKQLISCGLNNIKVVKTGCLGKCKSGPNIAIMPANQWYHYNNKKDIDELIKEINSTLIPTATNVNKDNQQQRNQFQINLLTSNKLLTVDSENSILSVLLENGHDIPFSCKQGLCGKCQIKMEKSDADDDPLSFNTSKFKLIKSCIYRAHKNKTINLML